MRLLLSSRSFLGARVHFLLEGRVTPLLLLTRAASSSSSGAPPPPPGFLSAAVTPPSASLNRLFGARVPGLTPGAVAPPVYSAATNNLVAIRAEMARNRKLQFARRAQIDAARQSLYEAKVASYANRNGGGDRGGGSSSSSGGGTSDSSSAASVSIHASRGSLTSFALPATPAAASNATAPGTTASARTAGGARATPIFNPYHAPRRATSAQKFSRGRAAARKRTVLIPVEGTTVRALAASLRMKLVRILSRLRDVTDEEMHGGSMVEADVVELLAADLGMPFKRVDARKRDRVRTRVPSATELARMGAPPRVAIVTVMGHVDHGKTTLLDALRGSSVAAREAGGITQGVSGFSVALRADAKGTGVVRAPGGKAKKQTQQQEEVASAPPTLTPSAAVGAASSATSAQRGGGRSKANAVAAKAERRLAALSTSSDQAAAAAAARRGGRGGSGSVTAPLPPPASAALSFVDVMTFIDTPGHALFASMRARGSSVTDVIVLVVDGKDGIMPQTRECVRLIEECGAPCVVAVTKCDAVEPTAAVERAASGLLEAGLATEPYGGDIPLVAVSARTGMGLGDLKAAISLAAESLTLRAPVNPPAEAVILDSRLIQGQGQVVDAIVMWGTLRVGDVIVAGGEMGRVKALFTDAVGAASLNRRLAGVGGEGGSGDVGGKGGNKAKGAAKGANPSSAAGAVAAGGEDGFRLTSVKEALPGTPVRVLGLRGSPAAGADLLVVEDEARARAVLEGRLARAAEADSARIAGADAVLRRAEREEYKAKRARKVAFELASARDHQRARFRKSNAPIPEHLRAAPWEEAILAEGRAGRVAGVGFTGRAQRQQGGQQSDVTMSFGAAVAAAAAGDDGSVRPEDAPPLAPSAPVVALILKADSAGGLAALQDAVERIRAATSLVIPRVASASTGDVTDKDVEYAGEMGAHILGFGIKVPASVQKVADRRSLRIRTSRIIYHLLDEACELLADYLPVEMEETIGATATVKAVFSLNANRKKDPTGAAGCVITEGTFTSAAVRYRLQRDGATLYESDELGSLRHLKDKVESVKKGTECGISLKGWAEPYAVGDVIQALVVKKKKAKLDVKWD